MNSEDRLWRRHMLLNTLSYCILQLSQVNSNWSNLDSSAVRLTKLILFTTIPFSLGAHPLLNPSHTGWYSDFPGVPQCPARCFGSAVKLLQCQYRIWVWKNITTIYSWYGKWYSTEYKHEWMYHGSGTGRCCCIMYIGYTGCASTRWQHLSAWNKFLGPPS